MRCENQNLNVVKEVSHPANPSSNEEQVGQDLVVGSKETAHADQARESDGLMGMEVDVGSACGKGSVGPLLHLVSNGPKVVISEDNISEGVKDKEQEVGKVNSHIRFVHEESDLSDFSDSVGDRREDEEKKVLHKAKRRHKKKAEGGSIPPLGNLSRALMGDLVKGSRCTRKKNSKESVINKGGQWKVAGDGNGARKEEGMVEHIARNDGPPFSPTSGIRLILGDEEESQLPETPLMVKRVDPLKKVEASSLYGLQNGLGFSFKTPDGANKEKI
jgi:hypothetical protein